MTSGVLELAPKQQAFAEAVLSGKYSYALFGGSIRGGKSYAAIALIILLCRIYPGSRWAIVRKDLPTLKRNTIPTFEKIKPPNFVGRINRTDWVVRCSNGSEIVFFAESLRGDQDLDRWKGLEVNGFKLGEANELSEASFNKAIERAGTWKCPGENQPPPLILMTCNPARNYVKRIFYDPWKLGKLKPPFLYMPSSIEDNPHLTKEYLASLENLRSTDPAGYARFVLGDWDAADDPDQLIKLEWVLDARTVEAQEGKKRLGVDVARFGQDDSVICPIDGNRILDLDYHHGESTDRMADIVQVRINDGPVDADLVMVDGVGLGAGVVDNLRRAGFDVVEVISGAKPIERDDSVYQFFNLRSQIWWEAREGFRTGKWCLDTDDPRLIEDLTAPRYSVSGDRVLKVESKDDTRRRIGRSTDAGDALIFALADIPKLSPLTSIEDTPALIRPSPWAM